MSIFPTSDDPAATDKGALPAEQQKRAEEARPQVDTTATEAEAGTPRYGDFGDAHNVVDQGRTFGTENSGSNDNPDEFSEFREAGRPTTEDYGTSPTTNPQHQQGHVEQNQAPDEVRAAQHEDTDYQRAAWSDDDKRYTGGHPEASWEENNDKEHSND